MIQSRKHHRSTQLLMLAAALPVGAVHAANASDATAQTLPKVTVNAKSDDSYQPQQLSSAKYTQALIDTPQTVAVIKKELLQDQGATTLAEALRNTPGVTAQLGENGNTASGDTFYMRGFSTESSIFVDGIRDLGAITRDTFNIEQVEVVKGSGAAETGRGISAGLINTETKLPYAKDAREVGVSVNTAEQKRVTADINQTLSTESALRLNVMWQEGGVEGRDVVENNGYAIAPAFATGLGTDTRIYAYSQHVRQENIPDGGIPTIGMDGYFRTKAAASSSNNTAEVTQAQADALNQGGRVDRENFYGSASDYENVEADMFSVKVEHDLSETTSVQNISRYGKTTMDRVMTGVGNVIAADPANPNTWNITASRQRVDRENTILANQTNVKTQLKIAGFESDVVTGLELLKEEQTSLSSFYIAGAPVLTNNLYNPNSNIVFPALLASGGITNGETTSVALYVLETLKLNDQFQLHAGLRADRYSTKTNGVTAEIDNKKGAVKSLTPFALEDDDTLLSWRAGALFKPTADSSVYLNYSHALTPPGSNNFDLSSSATSSNNSMFDPQETNTLELGTKWDVLDRKLSLTAAAYQTVNKNELTQDAITKVAYQQAKTTVKGLELGAVGQIAPHWQISTGLAFMDTQVDDKLSVSSAGALTTTDGVRWSPDLTATLWSDYTLNAFKFGAGVRYVSEQKRQVSTTVSSAGVVESSASYSNMPQIDAYAVADAAVSYNINKQATVALNVYNLFDEEYISTLNNSGARMILGQPRSAKLSLNYKF